MHVIENDSTNVKSRIRDALSPSFYLARVSFEKYLIIESENTNTIQKPVISKAVQRKVIQVKFLPYVVVVSTET
jgi:hypothetical protein